MSTEIIKIYDFSIRKGVIYEVVEKMDADAPKGFQEFSTTKYLFNDTYNEESPVYFNDRNKSWDNGLTESSVMLMKAIPDADARKIAIQKLEEEIIKPIEVFQGQGALRVTPDNDEYWMKFNVRCFKGQSFNTDNPIELYQLYLLVVGKKLTPKPLLSHPDFKRSQYVIVDRQESYNTKADKTVRKMTAMGKFYQLLNSNRDALIQIMNFINIPAKTNQDDSVLMISFERYIDDKNNSFQNDKIFNETVEFYGTKAGAEEIGIYSKLKELHASGNKRLEIKSGQVSIDGTYVSNTLKSSAEVIRRDKEMKKLYISILE